MRFPISILAGALAASCGTADTVIPERRVVAATTAVPEHPVAAAARLSGTAVHENRVAFAGTAVRGNQVAAAATAVRENRVSIDGPILHGQRPRPFPGAVFGIGNEDLKYLAPGARRWRLLRSERRGRFSILGFVRSPPSVLAIFSAKYVMHRFDLRSGKHGTIALPDTAESDHRHFGVGSIEVAPNGRDALVFLSRFGSSHVVYRVALDGRFKPRLVIPLTRGSILHKSYRGAVIVVPGPPSRRTCGGRGCLLPGARIVAFDISDRGVREKTLLRDGEVVLRGALALRGGDDQHAVVDLTVVHPRLRAGRAILRYRYGDDAPAYHEVAPYVVGGLRPVRWSTVSLARNAFIYLQEQPHGLDLWIQPLAPGQPDRRIVLPPRYNYPTYPYGMGARPDGSVWVHWGDHLITVDPRNTVRSVNLERVRASGSVWARAFVYAAEPESLWIGVEAAKGKGRFYARVNFAEVDRKAVPWPETAAAAPNCAKLPDLATLKKWQVHRETPCYGGARPPRALRHVPYTVVKQLPDGTKIVDGRERGCLRVRAMGCYKRCLPPASLIATPEGEVPVDALRLGMSVWTRDRAGNRVPAKVIRTNSVLVPAAHEMVSIRLADQRSLLVSSGHPDSTGYGLERLRRGQVYDGSRVVETALVGYDGSRTFDLLPSGDTGIYWANGIAIGSTLWRRPILQVKVKGEAGE